MTTILQIVVTSLARNLRKKNTAYLVRMGLATCASLHWNVTRIEPNHARLGRCAKGTHVCASRHSRHTPHRLLLHLPWELSRYRLASRRCVP
jgi:hypothetical protein